MSLFRVLALIESSRAFGRGLVRGVNSYNAAQRAWSIEFSPHGTDAPPEKWVEGWRGDGILARVTTPSLADEIRSLGKPAVDLRGILPDLEFPYVGSDHRALGKLAAEHLWEQGLRNFAFCGLPPSSKHYRDARFEWFAKEVTTRGGKLFPPPEYEPKESGSWDQRQQSLADWLAKLPKPIGIMTCQDDSGLQVIEAARRCGVRVPDDVAVLGVDDDELQCNMCCPPLSSVDPNAERIGYEAAALLHRLMNGESPPQEPILLPPRGIVVRQSTDLLAVPDPEVALALELIRERACEGLRVSELLKSVPLSRSVLENRFREFVGRTPKAEIVRVQLEHAKRLLIDTDEPLNAIAQEAGFRDARYLCDVFHRKLGTTPGTFRKEHQRNLPKGTPILSGDQAR